MRLLISIMIFFQSFLFAFDDRNLDIKIQSFVDSLSIDELVGQTIMVGYNSRGSLGYINTEKKLEEIIKTFKIGNIILYQNNFPHPVDIKNPFEIPEFIADLNNHLQSKTFNSQSPGKKIPLLIAIDQEDNRIG